MSDMARVIEWFGGRDTGMSSKAIATHMTTGKCDGSYPYDPADLGRCLRLLALFPEWNQRMPEMAVYGRAWPAMSERWAELATAMTNEVGIDWSKGNSAPMTYELMKAMRGPLW